MIKYIWREREREREQTGVLTGKMSSDAIWLIDDEIHTDTLHDVYLAENWETIVC